MAFFTSILFCNFQLLNFSLMLRRISLCCFIFLIATCGQSQTAHFTEAFNEVTSEAFRLVRKYIAFEMAMSEWREREASRQSE